MCDAPLAVGLGSLRNQRVWRKRNGWTELLTRYLYLRRRYLLGEVHWAAMSAMFGEEILLPGCNQVD